VPSGRSRALRPPADGRLDGRIDGDDPSTGVGDYEMLPDLVNQHVLSCASLTGIECRRKSDKADWTATGEHMICSPSVGSACRNSEQSDTDSICDDYEARFFYGTLLPGFCAL
jgi:hypothetical protein